MVRNKIDQSLIATLAGILMLCGASQCHNPELPVINNGKSGSPFPYLSQEGKLPLKPGDEGGDISDIKTVVEGRAGLALLAAAPEYNDSDSDTGTVVEGWDGLALLAAAPEYNDSDTETAVEGWDGDDDADRPGSVQFVSKRSTVDTQPDNFKKTHRRSSSLITHAFTFPDHIPIMGRETSKRLGKGDQEQALERQRSGNIRLDVRYVVEADPA
ncbi:MAG: hypothetical protein AAFP00_17105, partial [Bacteroidota bacterium]